MWKLFVDAEGDVIDAFTALGREHLSEDALRVFEKIACKAFFGAKTRFDTYAAAR